MDSNLEHEPRSAPQRSDDAGFGAWFRTLGQRGGRARGDIAGGLTAALVLPAIEGSYGLIALAPLGPEHASFAFLLGVFTAALATLVSLLAGGRGPLISGTSAALALLVAALIGELTTDARMAGADGQPLLFMVLAFTGLAVALAGVLQILLARLRLGGLVRYVPYPVHAGYMNGVAVLMVGAILPFVIGLPDLSDSFDWRAIKPGAVLVAATALWIAIKPPAWTRRVPSYLTGLVAATLLHHLLSATPLQPLMGPLFDPPALEWPQLDTLAPVFDVAHLPLLLDMAGPVLLFALVVGTMSTMQTALAGSTIDEMTHTRRDSTRQLFAQGVANVAVGAVGGLPSAGSTTRTKIVIDALGQTAIARLFFALGLLLSLLMGLRVMHVVPMAAIAGVFSAVAFSLVDDWTRHATSVLWRQALRGRAPRALAANYAVMLFVAAVTLFLSIAVAVIVGSLVAMVLFIRNNIKPPVRRVLFGQQAPSRKLRPAGDTALLRQHGERIARVELDGALFFGTAEAADHEIERLSQRADYIVIDLARVREIDASGARVLLHAADTVRRAGKHLLLAGLRPNGARIRTLRDLDVQGRLQDAQLLPDADRALELAEDRLLAQLREGDETATLTLAQTRLAQGLDADELALLQAQLVERSVPRGALVFRRGDPPDAMFVALRGQIGIWLRGAPTGPGDASAAAGQPDGDASLDPGRLGVGATDRRLVSYAAGVVFGEIGLLEDQTRTADALAEQDALVLELPRAAYEQLMAEHPALVAKLLRNVGLQLSSRVRALTDELQADQGAR